MRRVVLLATACALALAVQPSAQTDALKTAADALGVANIKTIGFAGSGANFSLGQNYTPNDPWPRVPVTTYTALINYDTASARVELLREMTSDTMPRGGGAPFFGQQRQRQEVSGNYAWNVPVVAAPPAAAPPAAAAPAGRGAPAGGQGAAPAAPAGPPPAPAPGNQVERMLFIWSTPQGFVKGALLNNATQKAAVGGGTEVSYTVGGKYKITGIINGRGEVEKVQTWIDQSIVGDMLVETTYTDYKKFGTVSFPGHIVQNQDGYPVLDLTIANVIVNPTVDITVPDAVRNAPPPAAPMVASEKLADGVFYLTGGTHHSLAIDMGGYSILVDTPNNQERAEAVIAKTKEVIPNKPIRYIVTSHHHWDHLGGIRSAMAENATIVTHASNKAFLERVFKTPHTLNPDKLAGMKNLKAVKVLPVQGMYKFTSGGRTVELHLLTGYEHTGDMLVVYLPKEKILAEPDAFTPPGMAGAPLVRTAVPYAAALYDNIQRLKLDVQTIAPFHGNRKSDVPELARAAGKSAANTN